MVPPTTNDSDDWQDMAQRGPQPEAEGPGPAGMPTNVRCKLCHCANNIITEINEHILQDMAQMDDQDAADPRPGDVGCLDEPPEQAPLAHRIGLEELSDLARLNDIKLAMKFIQALENASLDDEHSGLDADTLDRLRNPPTSCVDLSDPDLRLGLDLFLASIKSSQDTYTMSRDAILRRHPDDNLPSYDKMKRHIAEITGVVPIISDMCRNSCIAFTGPLAMLDTCSECSEPRFDPITKKALQHLYTIPPGPQLQAQWRDIESAQRMCY